MANYYDERHIKSIERVTLAETINLPKISNYPLTLENLKKGEYLLATNEYKDIEAKFYIKILSPLINIDNVSDKQKNQISTFRHSGSTLNTDSYNSSNFITLTIPKYILLNFVDVIPKGTEFIMACVGGLASTGGSMEIEKMRIIGIYNEIENTTN